jgi:hypothetical protein
VSSRLARETRASESEEAREPLSRLTITDGRAERLVMHGTRPQCCKNAGNCGGKGTGRIYRTKKMDQTEYSGQKHEKVKIRRNWRWQRSNLWRVHVGLDVVVVDTDLRPG